MRLVIIFCLMIPAFILAAAEPDVKQIAEKMDKLYRSQSSFAQMEMVIETADYKRTLKLKAWTEGMKKTFITIIEPKKEAGITSLKLNNEMWNYFPNIDKVMKVPPSMMMGSWMGSDFTNDDLVKEATFIDDYNLSLISPCAADFYCIAATPKSQTVTVWGRIVITVRKNDLLPVMQEFYDEKGKKMRVMHFKEIKNIGGRTIPTVMELIPLNKQKAKTVVIYREVKFDIKNDPEIFSLRNLQKKR